MLMVFTKLTDRIRYISKLHTRTAIPDIVFISINIKNTSRFFLKNYTSIPFLSVTCHTSWNNQRAWGIYLDQPPWEFTPQRFICIMQKIADSEFRHTNSGFGRHLVENREFYRFGGNVNKAQRKNLS